MSIHRSLVLKRSGASKRSVLTRHERLQKLLEEGKRKEEESVFGLPKVRVYVAKKRKKAKKQKEKPTTETPAQQ
ncbi:MAG: small basic protein [Planctomycetota bacterium]|nr:small basic protein [Planctomycetota bacterium]